MENEAGINTGAGATGAVQADYTANQGGLPTTEPATAAPQTVDNGKAARLEQEIAKYNKALKTLGIDPESDVVDKINRGLMNWDEVLNRQPQPQRQSEPPRRASERLAGVYQKVSTADPTADDFKEALAVMVDAIREQEVKESAQSTQQIVSAVKSSVQSVISNDALHKQLPPDLAELEKDIFYSSTDHFVSSEAFRSQNPNRFFTPEMYKYYAEMNVPRYNRLRDAYIELGRKQEREALTNSKPNNQTNVVPISAGTGNSPAIPAGLPITKDNMRARAAAYIQQFGHPV
jgi:hypothetical protein